MTDTRLDRARTVVDDILALARDFPTEGLGLWALAMDVRVLTGLAAEGTPSATGEGGK